MWARVILAVALLLFPTGILAQPQKRIALLVGNKGYSPAIGVLKNPFNDIALVGEALSKQGYEILEPIKDGKRSTILGGVRDLVRRLNLGGSGAIGFLYYSGHGVADKNTNINYIIPVDAPAPTTSAFWDESVSLDEIIRILNGAGSAAKFIIFDACRNELQLPSKDMSKGMVPVAEQQGMFIAYASAQGRTASDLGDKAGPYAAALAAELSRPGKDHLDLFQNVKEAVLASTGDAQQPWESNGLRKRVKVTLPGKVSPMFNMIQAITGPHYVAVVSGRKTHQEAAKDVIQLKMVLGQLLDEYITFNIREFDRGNEGKIFRAVVGPLKEAHEATAICDRLFAQGFHLGDCWISTTQHTYLRN
jgi:hypothetical protein